MMFEQSAQQKQCEQQSLLSYQGKKLLHMIELQVLDIESTLHYIQKKHTMHQLKEALSQIYNIFNETEPLFRTLKGLFLHQQIKKIMNCFGIIYVILMAHVDKGNRGPVSIIELDTKSEVKGSSEPSPKLIAKSIDSGEGESKGRSRPLGGVHLYNEQHSRHIQTEQPLRKTRNNKQQTVIREASKEELNRMVFEELNDNSHIDSQADQILDIFTFKFRYGKENQVVTFHDELLSISNFFKQAQNEAFQFLNKTKDQTNFITYNDTFKDVMSQIKKQKEQKVKVFTDKIRAAFCSIKSKTERKVAQIESRLISLEERQHSKEVNKHDRDTQTTLNIDEEIKSLRRRVADSEEKYRIMMDFKRKELEENTMIGLELQSEIGLKNREIVYLKLNLEENALMISNLSKRVKFLSESNRKIKDIVRSGEEPSKIIDAVQNKDEADRLMKEEADDEMALEELRKQRKMAKKILLEKRRSSISSLGPEKAIFIKRFTQQLDSGKMTPNNLLSRNLSQIYEGEGSQRYEEDSYSAISNKNNMLFQQQNRPHARKATKKVSIIPSQGEGSSHSIKSRQSLTQKSKRAIKEKHVSQIVESSKRASLVGKVRESPQSIDEDSVLDECSDQQKDYVGGRGESVSVNSEEYSRIEQMFQKQMSRTKNIINNNKRFSSFNANNNSNAKMANKSYFSSQKQNTQESVPSSSNGANRESSRSKYSFRNSKQEEQVKTPQRFSKRLEAQTSQPPQIIISVSKGPSPSSSVEAEFPRVREVRNLHIYSSQFSISIYEPVQRMEQIIQTETKKTQPEEETLTPQQKRTILTNNTIHISKPKEGLSQNENKVELITRSATQSKLIKNRHLKTLYSVSAKENQRYFFGKRTDKSVDEEYKNSQSCLEMQEDGHKEPEQIEGKKDAAQGPGQKMKEERQLRKLAIKCRTLQEFKARVAEMHKQRCGHTCKHLQKFVQNYIKYKQESKQKVRMPIKNLCDNIVYTTGEQQLRNYFPILQKKKS